MGGSPDSDRFQLQAAEPIVILQQSGKRVAVQLVGRFARRRRWRRDHGFGRRGRRGRGFSPCRRARGGCRRFQGDGCGRSGRGGDRRLWGRGGGRGGRRRGRSWRRGRQRATWRWWRRRRGLHGRCPGGRTRRTSSCRLPRPFATLVEANVVFADLDHIAVGERTAGGQLLLIDRDADLGVHVLEPVGAIVLFHDATVLDFQLRVVNADERELQMVAAAEYGHRAT